MTNLLGHKWIDVSRHGSPMWECAACASYKNEIDDLSETCPKMHEYLERKANGIMRQMRSDFLRLKGKRKYEAFICTVFDDEKQK